MIIQKEREWDNIWMTLAKNVSKKSKDPRLQVGCCVITCDNECVLSLGYNGDEKGGTNKPDSLEPGKSRALYMRKSILSLN